MAFTLVTQLWIGVALLAAAQEPKQQAKEPESEPWVVIDQPEVEQYGGLTDPQILVLPDGAYLASVGCFGEWSVDGVNIYRSLDQGRTWKRTANHIPICDANLFVSEGRPYVIGVEAVGRAGGGDALISGSTDSGVTWSSPTNITYGSLSDRPHLHSSSAPAMIQGGRVWRPFVRQIISDGNLRMNIVMASASVGDALQQSARWTWSQELPWDCFSYSAKFLMLPTEKLEPVLFVSSHREGSQLSVDVSQGGLLLTAKAGEPGWKLPDDAAGTAHPRDPISGRVQILAATRRPERGAGASTASLRTSADFVSWSPGSVLLRDSRTRGLWFKEADWVVAGDNLLAIVSLVRPASAKGGHERNLLVFLRVPQFRDRTPEQPPMWEMADPSPAPAKDH